MNLSRISSPFFCLILAVGIAAGGSNPKSDQQNQPARSVRPVELEVAHDPYIAVPRGSQPTSPAYSFESSGFTMVQVNVDANGLNIVGDAANEPSIAIDPTDPNNIVIGWRQFNTVNSDFRQAGYGYSTDAGATWTFPGVIEPGIFRSDPVLGSDLNGNIFFNSLTNSPQFLCKVFKTTNTGTSWDGGTPAHGGDKQWMTIDKSTSVGAGNIYAYWTSSFSSCLPGFFTRSTDNGGTFQNCITIPNDPFWGTLAVGPDGELYAAGSGFVVAKSTTAKIDGQAVTWDFTRTVSLDGDMSSFTGGPNPGGLLGEVWIQVDRSTGPTRGYVYLLCSVNRFSNSDPLDIMFARSTDGGSTWSAPVRVNDDPTTTAYQWFGTMSVAPNGRIDVAWMDTRDNPGSVNSSLYYSFSTDAGVTWSTNERLSESFNPLIGYPQQNKIGDYFDMVSDDEQAHVAWAGTFNGEQDVYYSTITPTTVTPAVPCSAITSIAARCIGGGTKTIQARVNLLGSTIYAGLPVTITIDGTPFTSTIVTNGTNSRANFSVDGWSVGTHTVSLIDPAGCGLGDKNPNCVALEGPDPAWDDDADWAMSDLGATQATRLLGNYPNPFNPSTTIQYALGAETHVTLRIYNTLGQVVATVVDEVQSAGYKTAIWNGKNDSGSPVASGLYIYTLSAGNVVKSDRMLFMK